MSINKVEIGVVLGVLAQTAAIVWWVAQQAATIETLEKQVTAMTDNVRVERQINLERDVADLKKSLNIVESRLDNHWSEIQASPTLKQFDELQFQINDIYSMLNSLGLQ